MRDFAVERWRMVFEAAGDRTTGLDKQIVSSRDGERLEVLD